MTRTARAFFGAAVAAALALVMVFVPATFGPAQVAQAFACYPPSTVNPACQPANLPILIEAGVVAAPTTTGTVGVATGGTAQLVANGTAGLGLLGIFAGFNLGGVSGESKGTMSMIGLKDQHIKTDPTFTPPAPTDSGCTVLGRPLGLASPYVTPTFSNAGVVTNPGSHSTCAAGGKTALEQAPPAAARQYGLVSSTGPGLGNRVVFSMPMPFWSGTEGTMAITANCHRPAAGTVVDQWRIASTSGWDQGKPGGATLTQKSVSSTSIEHEVYCGPNSELAQLVVTHRYAPGLALGMVLWNAYSPSVGAPGPELKGELSTRVDCLTTTGDIRTVTGLAFVEVMPGTPIEIPDTLCPPDEIAVGTEIGWKPNTGTEVVPIVPRTEPPQEIKELPQQFPDCFPPDGSPPCALTLWQAKPGQALESCGTAGELCDGWAQQPNAHQLYNCRYGPYPVDINRCSAYRFPRLGILPNMGLDGTPIPITAPPPATVSNPVNNPATGQPAAPPGSDPNAGADGKEDCWPTGWGVLNPASWVLMPLKCFGNWAFVPRPSFVSNAFNGTQARWAATTLAQMGMVMETWNFQPPAGCHGITVDVFFLGPPFQIMEACPGDMLAPLAGWSRLFINITFAVYGIVAVTRNLARIVEYPGIGSDG